MTSPFTLENRTVLVCDQNGVILLMLTHALRHLGMKVVGSVTTGEEAVEVARKTHPEFVVMEYVLLGMNGIEAAHYILAEHAACILLTTTITNPKIQEEACSAGIHGVLAKPYTFHCLPQRLEEAFTAFCSSTEGFP